MELVLVSGLSGSGKSVALKALEDSGYLCVDNLPLGLVHALVSDLASRGEPKVAVSADARSAATIGSLPEVVAAERDAGVKTRVLFLEASDASLVRRFSETRRPHPLARAGRTIEEAIAEERSLLATVAEAGQRIDTSNLTPPQLRQAVQDALAMDTSRLVISLESFGFKAGVPLDADFVFDTRFLPNPHYDPQLRPKTGKDLEVAHFLESQTEALLFLEDIERIVLRWAPKFAQDRRAALTVAIGCTGGRHRSVFLVERLAERLRPQHPLIVRHRDIDRGG